MSVVLGVLDIYYKQFIYPDTSAYLVVVEVELELVDDSVDVRISVLVLDSNGVDVISVDIKLVVLSSVDVEVNSVDN
jgi:hypothetical protein